MIAEHVAKSVMRLWPAPAADAPPDPLQSARARHAYERDNGCFFCHYFPAIDRGELRGKTVLDLGCYTGGRLVYWIEHCGFEGARGLDTRPEFARAGRAFARERGVAADFDTGFAEALPYPDDSFDYVATYDVLEHVRDVDAALRECHRVLKPGGTLLAVFPPFYQPLESHLGAATLMPALHWIFPRDALTRAHYELGTANGYDVQASLESWERLPTLNGITVRAFRRIVEQQGWTARWNASPLFGDGRRATRPMFRALRALCAVPAQLPVLEELFIGRIACVLEKPRASAAA